MLSEKFRKFICTIRITYFWSNSHHWGTKKKESKENDDKEQKNIIFPYLNRARNQLKHLTHNTIETEIEWALFFRFQQQFMLKMKIYRIQKRLSHITFAKHRSANMCLCVRVHIVDGSRTMWVPSGSYSYYGKLFYRYKCCYRHNIYVRSFVHSSLHLPLYPSRLLFCHNNKNDGHFYRIRTKTEKSSEFICPMFMFALYIIYLYT